MYFERIRVPDFVKGTPEKAYEEIKNTIAAEKKEVEELNKKILFLKESSTENLNKIFTQLKYLSDTFDFRKKVATINGKFYLMGFIPKDSTKKFIV